MTEAKSIFDTQDLDWDDVRAALMVGKYHSTTEAARQTGVNTSMLTMRVIALETKLGVKLFEHNHTNVTPTPFGSEFLSVADQAAQRFHALGTWIRSSTLDEKKN